MAWGSSLHFQIADAFQFQPSRRTPGVPSLACSREGPRAQCSLLGASPSSRPLVALARDPVRRAPLKARPLLQDRGVPTPACFREGPRAPCLFQAAPRSPSPQGPWLAPNPPVIGEEEP